MDCSIGPGVVGMRKSKITQKGLSQDVILELRGMSFSHFALRESCDETKGSTVLANAATVFIRSTI